MAHQETKTAKALTAFFDQYRITATARLAFHCYEDNGALFIEGSLGSCWLAAPVKETGAFRFVNLMFERAGRLIETIGEAERVKFVYRKTGYREVRFVI